MRFCLIFVFSLLLSDALRAQEELAPRILINGGDETLVDNMRNYLRIGSEACDTPLIRLNRLAPQVRTNIRRAANALGYYRSTFDLTFAEIESCWELQIDVVPGERIQVTEVGIHISGNEEDQELFQAILAEMPSLQGVPLHHGDYETVKSTLSAQAVENGYFSARFERSEILLDLTAYEAEIAIDFDTGPRYRLGEIRVQEVPGFSAAFVNRFIILEAGEPFSSARLLVQRQNLDESLYFRQISVTPQLSQANQEAVPVIIGLIPRPRHAWSTGLGFTTDTGPRVRASYENRYINSLGHHFDSQASLSAVRSQADVSYVIPLSDPIRESISFGAGYITENNDSFESNRVKLETAYRRQSSFGWLETYSVDYLLDDYVVDLQEDSSSLTMLGYSLSKTAADDFVNPTKGWHLYGQLRGASDSLLSDTSFLQFNARAKGIISFGQSRFISRLEFGTTWIQETAELPASIRYFAGGDRSIRGYKYQSLGTLNANGEVVGGKHLVAGSVEYDYPFKSNWRAAMFVDSGNAFSSEGLELKSSVGIGVRWLSPIGPIRADLAHALDDEGGFRLHITMGPDL